MPKSIFSSRKFRRQLLIQLMQIASKLLAALIES